MNDISDYIQGELIKTPFNLYNLIAKYIESNNNTKVAFVGGYLRDLLISKFHKKSFSKPVDIDLVIEGSSISNGLEKDFLWNLLFNKSLK